MVGSPPCLVRISALAKSLFMVAMCSGVRPAFNEENDTIVNHRIALPRVRILYNIISALLKCRNSELFSKLVLEKK